MRAHARLLVFTFFLLSVSSACAADSWRAVNIQGKTRRYLLHQPASVAHPAALVIVLHGHGGNARQARAVSRMNGVSDREGFLAAYPNGTGWMNLPPLSWNAGYCCGYAANTRVDDVAFISALIDDASRVFPVDPGQVYATGISNGGMMAYRLGCELSGKIAAIAPVAGALGVSNCSPKEPVSLIVFHGTADEFVRYEGGKSPSDSNGRIDPSVADSVRRWVEQDRCASSSQRQQKGNIRKEEYDHCAQNSAIAVYTLNGASHAWPGGAPGWRFGAVPTRELSASDVMWEFFRRHPRSVLLK